MSRPLTTCLVTLIPCSLAQDLERKAASFFHEQRRATFRQMGHAGLVPAVAASLAALSPL